MKKTKKKKTVRRKKASPIDIQLKACYNELKYISSLKGVLILFREKVIHDEVPYVPGPDIKKMSIRSIEDVVEYLNQNMLVLEGGIDDLEAHKRMDE